MPVYDYDCRRCGPFSETKPMAEYAAPQPCPSCADPAPRAIFSVPAIAGMDAAARTAHATNERSAHAPKSSKASGHGPNCGCCKSKAPSRTLVRPDGSKSFPGSRPWMISH
jgi:putative FmdB family regulatory protein